jgi:hypothetical protein
MLRNVYPYLLRVEPPAIVVDVERIQNGAHLIQ